MLNRFPSECDEIPIDDVLEVMAVKTLEAEALRRRF
jgi:hypothetical protein